MFGVVFILEDRQALDGLRDHVERLVLNARIFGAEWIAFIDMSRFRIAERFDATADSRIECLVVTTLEQFEEMMAEGMTPVYVEEASALAEAGIETTMLPDFQHPDKAAYIFGGDIGGLPMEGREDRTWISVPCGAAWPEAIASVVMYDRLTKG